MGFSRQEFWSGLQFPSLQEQHSNPTFPGKVFESTFFSWNFPSQSRKYVQASIAESSGVLVSAYQPTLCEKKIKSLFVVVSDFHGVDISYLTYFMLPIGCYETWSWEECALFVSSSQVEHTSKQSSSPAHWQAVLHFCKWVPMRDLNQNHHFSQFILWRRLLRSVMRAELCISLGWCAMHII